jgi:hypothetical protein
MTPTILDRLSLRFLDPDLELAYQRETIDQVRRDTLVVVPISIVLWLVAGVLLPTFTPIPASVSTPVVLLMAVVLLASIVPLRRLRSLDDVSGIGIAGIARVRLLGTPELKGKSDPIAVYQLIGLDLASEPIPTAAG